MPIPVISVARMREWEAATWATGTNEQEVIEQVGRIVAARALRMTKQGDSILALAGKGHNGDDARRAIPHLEERRTTLIDVRDPEAQLDEIVATLRATPTLIIDALFGIGLNRPLSTQWTALIDAVNGANSKVLSVDVPSGLDAETGGDFGTAVRATVTLTLGAAKTGLLATQASNYVGRLEVAPEIGLCPCDLEGDLEWITGRDFVGLPPARSVSAHKGSYGHVVIAAGWPGWHGAAVLTARGAQRAQPGLITLFTAHEAYVPIASQLQAVMVQPTTEAPQLPDKTTALLVGPGLATEEARGRFGPMLREAWRNAPFPVVVDASALGWLQPGSPAPAGVRVLTPHPGEAARLLDLTPHEIQANRPEALRRLSRKFGNAWVALKGHQTLIGRAEGPIRVNSSGNPHLAQGGSGDILAGFITGLLAQASLQKDIGKTLAFAVWRHGRAADELTATRDNWIPESLFATL